MWILRVADYTLRTRTDVSMVSRILYHTLEQIPLSHLPSQGIAAYCQLVINLWATLSHHRLTGTARNAACFFFRWVWHLFVLLMVVIAVATRGVESCGSIKHQIDLCKQVEVGVTKWAQTLAGSFKPYAVETLHMCSKTGG